MEGVLQQNAVKFLKNAFEPVETEELVKYCKDANFTFYWMKVHISILTN